MVYSKRYLIVLVVLSFVVGTYSFSPSRPQLLTPRRQLHIIQSTPVTTNNANPTSPATMNIVALTTTSTIFGFSLPSLAVDGSFGFLEGVPAGMIHPVCEVLLYGLSIAAALEGIKWRSVRTLADRIKLLKDETKEDTNDSSGKQLALIKTLQEERSTLMKGGHKDKHVSLGSIILGTGVFLSMEGGLSTYWRTGELFFGDHLIYGMILTAFWAISYTLTPAMQNGNVAAKNAHFGLNLLGLVVFTYQVGTGLEITGNVLAKTSGW